MTTEIIEWIKHPKSIEKAKAMVGKLTVIARTVTEEGGCFVGGTLVHTKDELKPIEKIQVGDWVLSQPENKGEQAFKRVVNTFSFDDKAVIRIKYSWRKSGEWLNDRFGGWQSDVLIVTGNHPFWVTGVDKAIYPDTFTWDDLKLGWTRADELFPGALIELSSGEQARITSSNLDRLWKTKQPDLAWEAHADEPEGDLINTKNGLEVLISARSEINHDFHDDETFRYRIDNPEWEEKWFYRSKVYNFEVEDFHTYYVGQLGAWVHNTNCYATTVGYLKKHGVFPSIGGQAFHTVGQVNAMVKEMLAQIALAKERNDFSQVTIEWLQARSNNRLASVQTLKNTLKVAALGNSLDDTQAETVFNELVEKRYVVVHGSQILYPKF